MSSAYDALHPADRAVLWPEAPGLSKVWARRTRLAELDASRYPALEYLALQECGLRALRLVNPALETLDVTGNALEALDVSAAPRLARLLCSGNPLRRIDVTGLRRLESAAVPDEAEIVCTELQKHVVPELRARFGLPKPTTVLAKVDGYQLHRHADGHNWDDGTKRLHDIVRHPACDLATALLVDWLSEPGEHTAWPDAASAPREGRKMVALLREIEERVASGAYATRLIPFDVRDVGGVDLSDDDPAIPAIMREPVRVAAGATVVAPPLAPKATKPKAGKGRGSR